MEEKKKKWVRPTAAKVRELNEVISAKSELIVDLCRQVRTLEEQIKVLRDDNRALEQSNSLMEQELARIRERLDASARYADRCNTEIERLKGRNLWERIIND